MEIRPVAKNDKPEWTRMRTALWPESPDDHAAEIDEFFDQSNESVATIVAELKNGLLCGFLEVGTRRYAEGCLSSPVGYIEGWWVDSEHREKGVGGALVDAAEEWARALGLGEMASDADIGNELSHNAHGALGYREAQRIVCFRKTL
jgi:aminoglycoside 6'-N-acetyltransferase I